MVKATNKKYDAIYARYSSHKQDDGTSIELQIDACERLVEGPVRHYVDRAKTGRALAGRVEPMRLLQDAENGFLQRVIGYKFDRLGRNMAEVATLVDDLDDWDVKVISATEGSDELARGILIGPIQVGKDGSLAPKEKPAPEEASEAGVLLLVAGAGFEPTTSGL